MTAARAAEVAARPSLYGLQRQIDALTGRQDGHEDVCAERYENIVKVQEENKAAIKAVGDDLRKHADATNRRFGQLNVAAWGVAGAIALLAAGLIGFLLLQVWPPPHPAGWPSVGAPLVRGPWRLRDPGAP